MPFRVLVGITIATALFAQGTTTATNANAPGVDTGTKIGNIVKSAVSTAFPAVTQIIDAIWPKNAADNSKQSKGDATKKLTSKETQTNLQQDAANSAKAQIKTLADVASELAMVEKFGKAASQAAPNVTHMQVLLALNTPPPNIVQQLEDDWESASDWLAPLADVKDADLANLSEYLQALVSG